MHPVWLQWKKTLGSLELPYAFSFCWFCFVSFCYNKSQQWVWLYMLSPVSPSSESWILGVTSETLDGVQRGYLKKYHSWYVPISLQLSLLMIKYPIFAHSFEEDCSNWLLNPFYMTLSRVWQLLYFLVWQHVPGSFKWKMIYTNHNQGAYCFNISDYFSDFSEYRARKLKHIMNLYWYSHIYI